MQASIAPANKKRIGLLGLTAALLAGCGGGGGGGSTAPDTGAALSNAPTDRRLQSLTLTKGVMDVMRNGTNLAWDVQNIIVAAPVDMPASDTTRACTTGGTLSIRVQRPASSPLGGLMTTQFSNCSFSGVLINGTTEVAFTRTVTEGPTQPWAGSVRFENYVIGSTGRQRSYHGLATAEGEVRGPGGSQPMTMRLTDFRIRDTPDTLGIGPEFTTTQFNFDRLGTDSTDPLYRLGGAWTLRGGSLSATLAIDGGSTLALLQNSGTERLSATVQWQDAALAAFSARLVVLPAGASGLNIALDLNQDGTAEHNYTFERIADLAFSI